MIYSYFEIGLKPAVVSCLTNTIAPPLIALESCSGLKRIGQSSSLRSKKVFCLGVANFLWRHKQGHIQGVCLAVMTGPFVPQVGYSALKSIIQYQTLSLQVSNAGGLEQATAYISLLTLHSTITKQQCPCLV